MPAAARMTDNHICPMMGPGNVPHVGGPVSPRPGATVFIGKAQPAARQGDTVVCVGPPDKIKKGSATVNIENMPAARFGDLTEHGGTVVAGHPKVMIGGPGQGAVLMKAGAPLVQPCDRPGADVTV
jgi:uncharacterized Zn-binding protein involved in type VI secretion